MLSVLPACSVTESLLTQMAAAIVKGVELAQQTRSRFLSILGQLKLGGTAIGKSKLRLLLHAACQIKVSC